MTLRAAALVAALVVLLPAPARAGTVTAGAALTFTADDGEANQLSVARAGDELVFSDVVPIAESAATCSGGGTLSVACELAAGVDVTLGDGNAAAKADYDRAVEAYDRANAFNRKGATSAANEALDEGLAHIASARERLAGRR